LTRTGKIARLAHAIREQLNHRLRDGELGKTLVPWLNSLPEVQAALTADFAGQPISPQNLSEWRRGGYKEWSLQQEALAMIQTIGADTDALKAASPDPLTDKLALWLVARYAVAAKSLKGAGDWHRLRELCFDIVLLRKGDHSAARLQLERERLELDREQMRELREEAVQAWAKEHRDEVCQGYLTHQQKLDLLGEVLQARFDEPAAAVPQNPIQSDQIKPNQTSDAEI